MIFLGLFQIKLSSPLFHITSSFCLYLFCSIIGGIVEGVEGVEDVESIKAATIIGTTAITDVIILTTVAIEAIKTNIAEK